MRESVKENEYIIISSLNRTARIIEIYTVPEENDRLFLVKYPNNESGLVFESQIIPLNQADQTFPIQ